MKLVSCAVIFSLILFGCSTPNPLTINTDSAQDIDLEKAQYYYNRGNRYSKILGYRRVKMNYLEAIQYNPTDYNLWRAAGSATMRMGEYDEAIQYFSKAIDVNPEDFPSYGNIGKIYTILEKYPNAISNYKKVLSLNPDDLRAAAYLAEIYYELHDYKNCEKYMKEFELILSNKETRYLSEDTKHRIENVLNEFSSYRTIISNGR